MNWSLSMCHFFWLPVYVQQVVSLSSPQKFKLFLLSCCSWSKTLVCVCVCGISSSASPLCISSWLCSAGLFFHHIVYLSSLVRLFPKAFIVNVCICKDCDLNVGNTSLLLSYADLPLELFLSSLLGVTVYFKY